MPYVFVGLASLASGLIGGGFFGASLVKETNSFFTDLGVIGMLSVALYAGYKVMK